MQLCLDGMVEQQYWSNRDSAKAVIQLGQAYALLATFCKFVVLRGETEGSTSHLKTDGQTIWIEVTYKGFDWFEGDGSGDRSDRLCSRDTFYIPTRQRLDNARVQRDWY